MAIDSLLSRVRAISLVIAECGFPFWRKLTLSTSPCLPNVLREIRVCTGRRFAIVFSMDLRRVPALSRSGHAALRCFALLFFIAAGGSRSGLAQELDTAIRQQGESRFTVMDEVQDPHEKGAFLKLYRAREPEERRRLADRFIETYPQSWLLGHAYEAAAKASIDLGSYGQAIQEAKQSLRLFPENPLLLVPLANVAAQQGLMSFAERTAKDALEYLDEFGPPAGTKRKAWPKLRDNLKASARFALGRVYASEGLAASAPSRRGLQLKSFDELTTALQLNRNDAEIYYLRGVVEEALDRPADAASDYGEAARLGQNLQATAAKALRRIYLAGQTSSGTTLSIHTQPGGDSGFNQFLAGLPPPRIPAAQNRTSVTEGELGSYAGSSSCASCHGREYESWRQTGMARMLSPYKAENIMGDFSPGAEYRGDEGVVIRMGNDGRPFFEMPGRDGRPAKYHVDFTIGSKWQQGYVTQLPDGQMQVLPIEYNKIHGRWVNYWKSIDPPSSVRADIRNFPRLLPATNYQLNCAMCHTSQLRAASTLEESIMEARFQEPGIDCEMCHGPSKEHADRMQRQDRNTSKNSTGADGLAPPVNFLKTENREEVEICAQCHRQSAERAASVHNELNYSSTGQSFLLPGVSRNYPEFLRRAFYKDGRFRETTFIVEAFTRSACYRQGTARCSSCHDPHPADAPANPASLKFLDHPDQRCLQCHEKFQNNPERHTHHAASSEGSRCEACHMPRIMNSVMFQARSHQIDDLPDSGMTARFGQKDSPNACLLCHTEKDTVWVSEKLAHW